MCKEKYTPEEIASKLETKAKQLRESGLSQEDLDMAAGAGCTCCGSSCQKSTNIAYNWCGAHGDDSTGSCIRSCINSSPD